MAHAFAKILVHITFSTKNRVPFIDDSIRDRLHAYLGGICSGKKCIPIIIGGPKDHIHVFCHLDRTVPVMDLIQALKHDSSLWIKNQGKAYSLFYWQSGYGVFSVNPTCTEALVDYIANQVEHHKHLTFQEEYIMFLQKHGIEYDPNYVWE